MPHLSAAASASSSGTTTPQTRSSARLRSSVAPPAGITGSLRPASSTAVRQTASSQAKQEAALRERKEREAARASNAKGGSPSSRPSVAGGRTTTTRAPFGSSSRGAAAAAMSSAAAAAPSTTGSRLRSTASSTAATRAAPAPKPRTMPSFSALPRAPFAVSSPAPAKPLNQAAASSTTSLSSTAGSGSGTGGGGGFKGRFLNAANSSMRKIGGLAGPSLSRLGGGGLMGDHGVKIPQTSMSGEAEQIKSFLRIRPLPEAGEASQSEPYLVTSSDTEVIMTAPNDSARPHWSATQGISAGLNPKQSQAYQFTKVFEPSTGQAEFFGQTAGPLVKSVLNGENGLVFAYGVTNAGKTYTIQGTPEARGIIPRSLGLLFASIKDVHSARSLRPVRSGRVDFVARKDEDCLPTSFVFELMREAEMSVDEGEKVKVDRNFEYAVFVSYAELYNEKIFDLLDTLPSTASASALPSHPSSSLHDLLHPSKRKPLALKNDADLGIKYVSGLREVRVRSVAEAERVVEKGMEMRQVWGTRMNEKSSRSHAVFTVKVVRIHGGAPEDPSSIQVSRLSIVDLAGSERTKNTGNTGDRLKEAGSINKSLMVLGQCMEVLQANQKKAAQGRKPAMVPFRHSKLTEMFQGFFAGDGRAVMMIHVNPYDTGFDENSHVMKFSAVAREIQTTTLTASQRYAGVVRRSEVPASPAVGGPFVRKAIPEAMRSQAPAVTDEDDDEIIVVTELTGDTPSGRASEVERERVEAELLVVQTKEPKAAVGDEAEPPAVEEEDDIESDDDEPDALVEHLFDVVRDLRVRLLEAELRCATIESDTRDEMAEEMAQQMQEMEQSFAERMRIGSEQNILLRDRQIDIVQRSAMKARPPQQRFRAPIEEDDDEEQSAINASSPRSREATYEPTSPTPAAPPLPKAEPLGLPFAKLALEPRPLAADVSIDVSEPDSDGAELSAAPDGDKSTDVDASFDSQAPTEEDVDESADPIATTEPPEDDSEGDQEEKSETDIDEDDDIEEDEDADSSFDAGAASAASPSPTPTPEPSPSKRSPKKPAVRSSPIKRTSPVKSATPARKACASSDDDGDEIEDVENEGERAQTTGTPSKNPLRESVGQQDASFTSPPGSPAPVKKKKRKLGGGKTMLTEDDVSALSQKSVPGVDIRRFARTSGASLY